MGKNAADAFESNPNVLNAFDKMRINPGTSERYESLMGRDLAGLVSRGDAARLRSRISGRDGAMKPFVPVDCVLIASSAAAGCFSYAGISQVDQDESTIRVYEGPRIPMITTRTSRTSGSSDCLRVPFPSRRI